MRTSGFLIAASLFMVLAYSCKTSSTSTKGSASTTYREDLSALRPALKISESDPTEVTTPEQEASQTSTIAGHLKEELDSVNQIIISQNKVRKYVDGFTIQVYTGNDRDKAYAARSKVLEINPDLRPTMRYYQPSYKVKVGQYVSKLEAHQIYESLRKEFPLALLIPERIAIDYD